MGDGYGIYISGAGRIYLTEECQIEGTTGRIYGSKFTVYNQDSLIRTIKADGTDDQTFPATSDGLDGATAAAVAGDTIILPPGVISGDHILGDASYRAAAPGKTRLTGQITLVSGTFLTGFYIYRTAFSSTDIYGIVAPSSGLAEVELCRVEILQVGSGDAAAIKGTAGGKIDVRHSLLIGYSEDGDGYAARRNGGNVHIEHTGVYGSTDWYDGDVYDYSVYNEITAGTDFTIPADCPADLAAAVNGPYDLGVTAELDSTSMENVDRIIDIPYPCYIRNGAADNPTYVAIHGDWLKYSGGAWVSNLSNDGIYVEALYDGEIVATATLAAGAADHETRNATFSPPDAIEIDTIRIRITRGDGGLATRVKNLGYHGFATLPLAVPPEAVAWTWDGNGDDYWIGADAGGGNRLGDVIISAGSFTYTWSNGMAGPHPAHVRIGYVYLGGVILFDQTKIGSSTVAGSVMITWPELTVPAAPTDGLQPYLDIQFGIDSDPGAIVSEDMSYTISIRGIPIDLNIESANLYNICPV